MVEKFTSHPEVQSWAAAGVFLSGRKKNICCELPLGVRKGIQSRRQEGLSFTQSPWFHPELRDYKVIKENSLHFVLLLVALMCLLFLFPRSLGRRAFPLVPFSQHDRWYNNDDNNHSNKADGWGNHTCSHEISTQRPHAQKLGLMRFLVKTILFWTKTEDGNVKCIHGPKARWGSFGLIQLAVDPNLFWKIWLFTLTYQLSNPSAAMAGIPIRLKGTELLKACLKIEGKRPASLRPKCKLWK